MAKIYTFFGLARLIGLGEGLPAIFMPQAHLFLAAVLKLANEKVAPPSESTGESPFVD